MALGSIWRVFKTLRLYYLHTVSLGVVVALIAFCGETDVRADATTATPFTATPSDYADPGHWLCRPGRADACGVNLDATIVAEDGSTTREAYKADPDAPIDCFYVYPTVSHEESGNADFSIDGDLTFVAGQQFARFGERCRLFAPVYRQITIPGLVSLFSGRPIPMSRDLAYNDVLAAWRYYLANDNHGRGFVLVGHSQGTGMLARLVREEIDGRPIQSQLVSALLMGGAQGEVRTRISDPSDLAFPHIPVCKTNGEIGCVIGFSTFRAESPPLPGTLFEKSPEGSRPVCANPAALGGGSGVLDAYFSTSGALIAFPAPKTAFVWTDPPTVIDTPFVKVPGFLSASCVTNDQVAYLAVSRNPSRGGHRVDDIKGDLITGSGKVAPDWGLHLIDVNLTMGNLLTIVGDQTPAYLAKGK